MPQSTFNPIRGPFRSLPQSLSSTVVVAVQNGVAKRNLSGQASGSLLARLLRRGPRYFQVDVSPHVICDELRAQLTDAGVFVVVQFDYLATAIDPEGVVTRNVRDARSHLADRIYQRIRDCASGASLAGGPAELRRSFDTALNLPFDDPLFRIEDIKFDVQVEGAAASAPTRPKARDIAHTERDAHLGKRIEHLRQAAAYIEPVRRPEQAGRGEGGVSFNPPGRSKKHSPDD